MIDTAPMDPWVAPLETLRKKWSTVPASQERMGTPELLRLGDRELLDLWRRERHAASTGLNYSVRGWYYDLYRDALRGKRVLDVGAGLGMDAFTLAEAGAHVTLVDIVPHNVELQRRLAKLLRLDNVAHYCIESLTDFDALPEDFDAVWAQGSLINAPFDVTAQEVAAILEHLPVGGRWIELAYPRERWEREGRLPFSEWGEHTDGAGTPWMEWYDLSKLKALLAPAEFDTILALNFHNDDFNWFDLVRRL